MPPGVPRAVVIRIDLVPEQITWNFFIMVFIFLLSSLVPAWHAARKNIVNALGHV